MELLFLEMLQQQAPAPMHDALRLTGRAGVKRITIGVSKGKRTKSIGCGGNLPIQHSKSVCAQT